uniref:Small ribosomal subunit protein uS5m n=1 Tax=Alona affinis TaxID=381656 RepID=A0A9N6ZDK0_9CRUS|nr:EOG090X0689 [Alona affinis]
MALFWRASKLPADSLWKGVTSVSNSGKKRGRGKGMGKKTSRNLNKGQIIGVGKCNMVWPGLNSPIIQGKELIKQKQLPEDPEFQAKLHKLRDSMGSPGIMKLSPLERGWSGTKMPGRTIGPPDPIGEDTFEGFETTVLELKSVSNMKGNLGRVRSTSAFVITGNGNGLAGFGLGKAQVGNAALKKARNRAGQKLMYIERYNNHTVLHDFFTRFNKAKIFVSKKPEGYGLVCHRAIREICKAVGIKDIYAKVEGSSKNIQHVTKAFMIGLLNQKTFDKIAEETKLNVVEFRKERDNYPQVMAKPTEVKSVKTVNDMDLNLFLNDGKVASKKRKVAPFYERLPSWENHLIKTERFRNRDQVRTRLMAQYGEVRSFLADRYPECRQSEFGKKKTEDS